jgi:glycosyltransferase involved in cell wall biosynthesis
LLVSGVGLRGDGYPNAERTLEILRKSGNWEVQDRADWLPAGTRLWSVARETFGKRARLILRLASSSAMRALVSTLSPDYRGAMIYLPYPALFTLWWVSFVPRRWRARYIADAYISVWDSMFRDRRSHRRQGLISRFVKRFEGRALRAASLVLTDTEANRELLIRDFSLDPGSVRSLPLAINEELFCSIDPVRPKSGPLRVLFVGTLIPLHGVSVVLDAVRALADDTRFEFRLIGDGQLSGEVEEFLGRNPLPRLTWIRGWRPLDQIATEIGAADICLGVFGGSGKAARVLPLKVYMYLAAGRAVVTQAEMSLPAGAPYPPIVAIDISRAHALSSALVSLAEAPTQRLELAASAREYYGRWLANSRAADFWESI